MHCSELNEDEFLTAVRENEEYGVLVLDCDGIVTSWNKGAELMKGYKAEEVIGKSYAMFFSDEDQIAEVPKHLMLKALLEGKARSEGWRYKKNGRRFWANTSITPIYQSSALKGFLKITSDLGDLKETRLKFEKIFESDLLAIGISDMKTGQLIDVNKGFENLFGIEKKHAIGWTGIELGIWTEELRDKVFDALRGKNQISNFELTLKTKDGRDLYSVCTLRIIEVQGRKLNIFIVNDITDRILKEREILKSNTLFHSVFEKNPNPMCITSYPEGLIIKVNSSFLNILGYSEDEVIGKTSASLKFDVDQTNIDLRKQFHETGNIYNERARIRTKSNQILDVIFSAERIEVDGEIQGVSSFIDVTEQRLMEKELLVAKNTAETAAKLQEEFLANMSHEIRTPLSAIIGFSEVLKSKLDSTEDRELLKIVSDAGTSLLRIINDILDISKLDSGAMTFESHPFEIRDLLHTAEAMLAPKAKEKGIELEIACQCEVPDKLSGDSARLSQILLNLMSNALKFTVQGKVRVCCCCVDTTDDKYLLRFKVSDTGIGIPEHKISTIFERFKQAESSTSREYGGTGLGLSIVKQMIEMQGGTLSVTSEVGKGSVFEFTIPYARYRVQAPIQETPEPDLDVLKGMKILLVEDNNLNIKLIEHIFKPFQVNMVKALNGQEALDNLKSNEYDLILMDIQMPIMDGYDATINIRHVLGLHTPIIAMTANAMPGERDKCLSLGMTEYVSKPIDTKVLFRTINSVIKQFGRAA